MELLLIGFLALVAAGFYLGNHKMTPYEQKRQDDFWAQQDKEQAMYPYLEDDEERRNK